MSVINREDSVATPKQRADRDQIYTQLQLMLGGYDGWVCGACLADLLCEMIIQGSRDQQHAHAILNSIINDMHKSVDDNWEEGRLARTRGGSTGRGHA